MNNKGADQTAQKRRLIWAFVVRIWQKRVFSWHGSTATIILTFEDSNVSKRCKQNGKQCRLWSEGAVWSGFTLFPQTDTSDHHHRYGCPRYARHKRWLQEVDITKFGVGWLCWGLTSQSTIFQSCRDGTKCGVEWRQNYIGNIRMASKPTEKVLQMQVCILPVWQIAWNWSVPLKFLH